MQSVLQAHGGLLRFLQLAEVGAFCRNLGVRYLTLAPHAMGASSASNARAATVTAESGGLGLTCRFDLGP